MTRWSGAPLCALVLLAICACSRDKPARAPRASLEWRIEASAGGGLACRVNGRALPVDYVKRQMQATKTDQRQALEQLIEQELLVQEAIRRRLEQTPAMRQLHRRVLASRLLENRFAERFSKADIPAASVAKAYELNSHRYDRPALVKVSHILVAVDQNSSPAQRRRALAAARLARRLATASAHTPQAFRDLGRALSDDYPALKITAESLITPRHGRVVEPFAAAAFGLEGKGDVSPVVSTSFGYHVIYLEDRKEELHRTVEQAEAEIRDLIYDEARGSAVEGLLARLRKSTPIETLTDKPSPPGKTR